MSSSRLPWTAPPCVSPGSVLASGTEHSRRHAVRCTSEKCCCSVMQQSNSACCFSQAYHISVRLPVPLLGQRSWSTCWRRDQGEPCCAHALRLPRAAGLWPFSKTLVSQFTLSLYLYRWPKKKSKKCTQRSIVATVDTYWTAGIHIFPVVYLTKVWYVVCNLDCILRWKILSMSKLISAVSVCRFLIS